MGRIVNPTLMRMGMNAIKKNVDSYGSNYRKAKSTLARYSNEAISAKGEAVDAMINQVLCYESVMDMFIVVAESMIKDCDEMSMRVGDEYLNEDSILEMLKVQKEIRQRCSERIEDYRHKQTQFATAAPLAEHCRMQVNLNSAAKERADIAITALNNKIKKIDEIENNTNNLFLESKSALAELNKCISDLEKSGKGGFTYDTMPAWAVAMNSDLLDKYTKSMLSKGRLNEDFVKKFSNLTIAEMTPVEKAVYNKYTDFLLFDAKPEDMNKVIKHYYKKTWYGNMQCRKSAYELKELLDIRTNMYCMTSAEGVDSKVLERCTILKIALSRDDTFKVDKIHLSKGHYKYTYTKHTMSSLNNASPLPVKETYTTFHVFETPSICADQVSRAKAEYLKNLLRKDNSETIANGVVSVIETGISMGMPEMKVGGKISNEILKACTKKIADSSKYKEDFGIDSNGIATISNSFDLRASLATAKTNEGDLIYNLYPTKGTLDKINFYNEVFKNYNKKEIDLNYILEKPEKVNKKLTNLEKKMSLEPYKFKNKLCKSIDALEDEYYKSFM